MAELQELELEEDTKTTARLPSVPSSRLPAERPSHRTRKSHTCVEKCPLNMKSPYCQTHCLSVQNAFICKSKHFQGYIGVLSRGMFFSYLLPLKKVSMQFCVWEDVQVQIVKYVSLDFKLFLSSMAIHLTCNQVLLLNNIERSCRTSEVSHIFVCLQHQRSVWRTMQI